MLDLAGHGDDGLHTDDRRSACCWALERAREWRVNKRDRNAQAVCATPWHSTSRAQHALQRSAQRAIDIWSGYA